MPPHPHPSPSALTRDRLARGQPPTPRPKPNPTKGAKSGLGDAGEGARSELWEMQERKRRAAEVLASWEMLAWFAGSRGENIPQTRLRFQKLMIGLEEHGVGEEWVDEGEDVEGGEGGGGEGGSSSGGKNLSGGSGRGGRKR